jgi:hypothetical protein
MVTGSIAVLVAGVGETVGGVADEGAVEPFIARGYKIALDPTPAQERLLLSY